VLFCILSYFFLKIILHLPDFAMNSCGLTNLSNQTFLLFLLNTPCHLPFSIKTSPCAHTQQEEPRHSTQYYTELEGEEGVNTELRWPRFFFDLHNEGWGYVHVGDDEGRVTDAWAVAPNADLLFLFGVLETPQAH